MIRSLLLALVIAGTLRFGLEPAAWLFYEIHFALEIGWMYWGYSGVRGAAYLLDQWSFGEFVPLGVFAITFMWLLRSHRQRTVVQ